MTQHGFESYYVEGEGVLGVAGEGRAALAAHAETVAGVVPAFRFSRMGPNGRGHQLGEPNLRRVARSMTSGGGGFGSIPAGYTYLGQFTDHDFTFDKTDVTLGTNVSPGRLVQDRSPALDLDSLYGAGPGDPVSAKFYSDGLHLKIGDTAAIFGIPAAAGFDLPRVGGSGSQAKQREALIADKRNDENLAVAQTHLAMIRFHNRVVDKKTSSSMPDTQRFATARDLVTRHYQWLLRTDYLPRIVQPSIVNSVFNNGRKIFEVGAPANQLPTMPIEFSVAAFRLGHAMIRDAYDWNREFPAGQGTLSFLFEFTGLSTTGQLMGVKLPSNWIVDWRRLYDLAGEQNRPDLAPPARFNRAARIDTTLAPTLHQLPDGAAGDGSAGIRLDLAFRNLARAKMVGLATGQQMAAFLRRKGVNVKTLTRAQLRDGKNGAVLDGLTQAQRQAFLKETPLWFYVLREAELNNGRLTGVGGRIVVETFHRAIEGSTSSIVRDPAWRPSLGPNNTTFRMSDLLMFAFEGKKNLLARLGD